MNTAPPAVYKIVLLDHTTDATPAAMKPAGSFQGFIDAWIEQVDNVFGNEHGHVPLDGIRIGSAPDDRQPDEIACNFRDTIPEAPGALAYHTITNGIPDIELGVDLFSSLTDQGESLSSGGSHELLEMFLDPGANRWADKATGMMAALEACDVVQNTGYAASNGMFVSNFLCRSYFNPGASGPYDYLQAMSSADDISNGYEIQAISPTNVSQVGGELDESKRMIYRTAPTHRGILSGKQRKQKKHPYSRAYRRGLRLS